MATDIKKNITIEDVARRAGTALSTASLALNGKARVSPHTREAVLQAAQELGFEANPLARRLAGGASNNHIDIFSLMLNAGVALEKLKTIHRLLTREGYDVLIHSYDFYDRCHTNESLSLMRSLCRQRPRAIVCATPGVTDEVYEYLNDYQQEGGVAICYDDPVPISCDNVLFDFEHSLYLAAGHLVKQGHRDLGLYVQGQESPPETAIRGFSRALQEHGMKPRRNWFFGSSAAGEEGGFELAKQFLRLKQRPTAMCIVNDASALAFSVEMGRAGIRIPEEVSIIGHDDLPLARCAPVMLSSVTHPTERIAEEVVRLLTARLNGNTSGGPVRMTIRGELVIRDSVAPHL
jgi:DNA-binding LacI/PurR family transcriptional regulator